MNRLATYTYLEKKSKSFPLSAFELRNLRSERNLSLKVHSKEVKSVVYISVLPQISSDLLSSKYF